MKVGWCCLVILLTWAVMLLPEVGALAKDADTAIAAVGYLALFTVILLAPAALFVYLWERHEG